MLTMSRRGLLASAAVTAAFGLSTKLAFVNPAHAETPLEPTTGFYKYKVGSIEVTAVYDVSGANRTTPPSSRMPRWRKRRRHSPRRG
jgi:hypothetical protein